MATSPLRPPFNKIRKEITEAEKSCHKRLEATLQAKINDGMLLKSSDSADMGNELRTVADIERKRLHSDIENITGPLRDNILKLINLPDKDLLETKKRAAELAIFQPENNR